ncbi:Protein obstructor-E [Gryllus bimaculatus]|nr:Protein obstructor-E [Gryllus bimaculatus]
MSVRVGVGVGVGGRCLSAACGPWPAAEPAQPTEDCPHQYGYFREGRDAGDCGRFVTCVDGRGFHLQCPEGLAFSEDTLRCDWPDQVDSCDAEAFLGFRCPDDGSSAADGYRFYRSPSDCQKYFLCVSGRPRLYSCAQDEAFNEDIGVCDGVENVTAWSCAPAVERRSQGPGRPNPAASPPLLSTATRSASIGSSTDYALADVHVRCSSCTRYSSLCEVSL